MVPQGNPTTGSGISTTGFTVSNYFAFSLTPANGKTLSLTTLKLDDRISATGPTNLALQYSTGGSFTTASSVSTSTSFSATPMVTYDLTGVSALQNCSTTISFRFVGTGASSSAGRCGWTT